MLEAINAGFNNAKRAKRDARFIVESVLDVEEVLPGSDEELDDVVDADSVPEDVYKEIDKALDKMIEKSDYDDTDAEGLLDDDLDDDDEDIDDAEIEVAMSEAVNAWVDDESLGHPNTGARKSDSHEQPLFRPTGSMVD